MLSTFTRRLPSALGICRRTLITQPVVIQQGDGTVPIFLNPPSEEDRAAGNTLRSLMANKNVDLDYVDLKMFQIKQENYEFDPPALPREQSSCWGYLWGNRLVRAQMLLNRLRPEDEYLRGFLEKTTTEFRRKMKVHYPNADWEGRLLTLKNGPNTFGEMYNKAKLEAIAELAAEDTDGYVNLYRNNSYISSYDEGDDFGYNIPSALETKLENLMQFDWDQTVGSPEGISTYVSMLHGMVDVVEPRLKALEPKLGAKLQSLIKKNMRGNSDMLGQLVGVLRTSSESMVGEAPSGVKTKVGAVLAALDPKDSNAIVATFRGLSSASEAAFIKGKTNADLVNQFSDCDESRLNNLCLAVNACNSITEENATQVVVSGLFNNVPYLFRQFVANPQNVAKFGAANGAALDALVGAVNTQKDASTDMAASLATASHAVETWLASTLSMDKATVASVTAEFPTLVSQCGQTKEKWLNKVLDSCASGASFIDKVEAMTFKKLVAGCAGGLSAQFYGAMLYPGAGNYNGWTLQNVANNENFSSQLAEKLSASMVASGRCTPAQAQQIASGVGRLPEMKAVEQQSKKVAAACAAQDNALSNIQWVVEEDSVPGLMMAYDSVPHASFENVNAY